LEALIKVEGLSKSFGGMPALDDVSFTVCEGEILGLIGPNGAGKTTLLECVVGLQPSDAGAVKLASADTRGDDRTGLLFYLPDGVTPYDDLHAVTVLSFFADVFGTEPDYLDQVARVLDIEPALSKRVRTLSKGFRRRLLLALSLLCPRPVLILDEPFDGLDLRQTLGVMALLRAERSRGRTLVLSIHQLTDAEEICDRLLLLSAGQVLGVGTLTELRAQAGLPNGSSLREVFLALT
jgi:ABC-2 type transport system ATP-binding protein